MNKEKKDSIFKRIDNKIESKISNKKGLIAKKVFQIIFLSTNIILLPIFIFTLQILIVTGNTDILNTVSYSLFIPWIFLFLTSSFFWFIFSKFEKEEAPEE